MKLVVAAETHTVTLTLQNGYSEVLYIVRREDGHAFVHGSLVQRRAMMRMTRAYNPTWTPSWQPIKSTRVNIQNLFSGQKNMKNICKICIVDLLLESYCDIFLLLACLVHSIKYMFSIFKQYILKKNKNYCLNIRIKRTFNVCRDYYENYKYIYCNV